MFACVVLVVASIFETASVAEPPRPPRGGFGLVRGDPGGSCVGFELALAESACVKRVLRMCN